LPVNEIVRLHSIMIGSLVNPLPSCANAPITFSC
jgi:hypothetical protein